MSGHLPRGICARCGRTMHVRLDGTMRQHRNRIGSRREELWQAYLNSPGGATDALYLGRYEGFVEALKLTAELQAALAAEGVES